MKLPKLQPVDINKMDFTKPLFKTEVNNDFADPVSNPKPLEKLNRGMYQDDIQNIAI